jgi:hypothetical protein
VYCLVFLCIGETEVQSGDYFICFLKFHSLHVHILTVYINDPVMFLFR